MKIRLSGLTKKWTVNVLLITFLFLVLINICIGWFSWNYYYDSVYQVMDTRLGLIADNFSSYVRASDDDFDRAAVSFAENYEDKEYYEVQIFSAESKMLVSTSGFLTDDTGFPDYEEAVSEESRLGVYKGRLLNGEHIMAVTIALGNNSRRAVRMVVSMEGAREQAARIVLAAATISLVFFLIICVTGMFFIRSIVVPMNKISGAAKEIAQGNFDIKIESNGKGEIGELCSAINDMATELGSTEKMKNNFISSVSHELRTPLTAIKGWSETVRMASDDSEIVSKGMDVISAESERLNTIVEDLLDFSRIQNGALTYDMELCDMTAPLSEVVTAFAETASHQGIRIIFEPRGIPIVTADATRLKQVFVNIIDNAIKNTAPGGKIRITCRKNDDRSEVIIQDTGKGISKEDLGRIKEKFFKSEANKTVRGSGIGLAIADEIVKAHNGELIITSIEKVGTTVRISLPYEKENQ